jgi:hypothetical protein
MHEKESAMAVATAFQFYDMVVSPDFATKHSDLIPPLVAAASKRDANAAASLASSKLGLQFTGDELKQAGGQIATGLAAAKAASKKASPAGHAAGFMAVAAASDQPFGPGGFRFGIPGVTPPGADIVLKIILQTVARQLKSEGKSDDEVRQALMGIAGGSSVVDQATDGKSITGDDTVDDVLKSVASVGAGFAEGLNSTMEKVADTIFSGW